jgi:hypothetical protein
MAPMVALIIALTIPKPSWLPSSRWITTIVLPNGVAASCNV